jgi:carbon monoxide dehydrogenase subunit G
MATIKVHGRVEVEADASRLWEALLREDVLRACIPGCHGFTAVDADRYHALVSMASGPFRGDHHGEVHVVEQRIGEWFLLHVHSLDVPRSFEARGTIELVANDRGTLVNFAGEARLEWLNPLAAMVAPPIARALAGRFFHCIAHHLASS